MNKVVCCSVNKSLKSIGSLGSSHIQSHPVTSSFHMHMIFFFREVISQDMVSWENGSMWPFSCYAYAKGVPVLPGIRLIALFYILRFSKKNQHCKTIMFFLTD